MLDLYYWTTPNGHKITIFLEETGLPYRLRPVNISKGEQFDAEFLAISPNNRIPAIVDPTPPDGGPLRNARRVRRVVRVPVQRARRLHRRPEPADRRRELSGNLLKWAMGDRR